MFIFLARLLDPRDFGLAAMALAGISVTEMVFAPALSRAMIQTREDIYPYLNAYWSLWIVRSSAVAALALIAAPVFTWYFKSPEAGSLSRWLAAIILIRSLVNPETALIFKNLEISKKTRIDGMGQLAMVATSIGWSIVHPSAQALVAGYLAREVMVVAMSYVVLPYRPRWSWEWSALKKFFSFGLWNWILGISQFFVDMLDILVVGRLLPASSVGFYAKARNLGFMPYSLARQLFFKIVFPLYAIIQDEKERCGRIFIRSVRLLIVIALPAAVAVIFFAGPVVAFLFGEKWAPMIGPIKILFGAAVLRTFLELAATFLQGIGRPDIHFKISLWQLAPMIVLLPVLARRHGIEGAAVAILLASVSASIFTIWQITRQREYFNFSRKVRLADPGGT